MPYEVVMQYPGCDVDQLEREITTRKEATFLTREHRLASGGQYPVWSRFQKPTRYLVKPSGGACYDGEELEVIKAVVKEAGGKNPRTALLNGWSNQPEVVTFSGYSPEERAVKVALDERGYMTVVLEKDW